MVSSGPFQSCDVSIITPFFCVTTEATFYIPSQRRLYLIIQKIQLSIISELHKELQHQKTNKLRIRVLHPITQDLEKNDHRLLNKSNGDVLVTGQIVTLDINLDSAFQL